MGVLNSSCCAASAARSRAYILPLMMAASHAYVLGLFWPAGCIHFVWGPSTMECQQQVPTGLKVGTVVVQQF